jgi:hypothetical protein
LPGKNPRIPQNPAEKALYDQYMEKLKPINDEYYAEKAALAEKYEKLRQPVHAWFFGALKVMRNQDQPK